MNTSSDLERLEQLRAEASRSIALCAAALGFGVAALVGLLEIELTVVRVGILVDVGSVSAVLTLYFGLGWATARRLRAALMGRVRAAENRG